MGVWFTSDTHFSHHNIIDYCKRPFSSVEEMNETLIRNWNETVSDDDDVVVVGDVCLGKLSETLKIVETLKGRKHLICGNHDRPYEGWYREPQRSEWRERYLDAGFIAVMDYAEWVFGADTFTLNANTYPEEGSKTSILVSHLPCLHPNEPSDESRSAFEKAKLRARKDAGVPVVCGHVHDRFKTMVSTKGSMMVNVGVDVWGFKPVCAEVVLDTLGIEKPY